MRLRALGVVAVGTWLVASSAFAQTVFGGAQGRPTTFTSPPASPAPAPQPSPVTPILPPPPRPQDLFRAGPDTYAPRFDRPTQSLFFPYLVTPGYPLYGNVHDRLTTVIVTPVVVPAAPAPPEITAAPAPAPVAPPGVPKTFYVIPGCYAGDTRPRADRLPAGCRTANMRTIRPASANTQ